MPYHGSSWRWSSRDPSIGLNADPISHQLRTLVLETPALTERVFLAMQKGTREMAALLAEEPRNAPAPPSAWSSRGCGDMP
ncbi:hypothetical protein [Streptomyces sp. NPDC002763]|uniref:hypothetical protein n=1 Tax=Streptomyces sp. NPDC002763 TaxID=3154427 RepID=UPI00331D4D80